MAADRKNKQTSSSASLIQGSFHDESIRFVDDSRVSTRMRFEVLSLFLYGAGILYAMLLASFCIAYIGWGIVPSTEILILMTLPGYVITTVIGAIVGSAIDR